MRPSIALLVCLPSSVLAQTLTVPASYAGSPASSSSTYPVGVSGPMRVQVLYAAAETGVAGLAVLNGVEFRGNATATNAARSAIDLQIALSTSPLVRTTMTSTFAANHGPDLMTVYSRKLTSVAGTAPNLPGQYSGMILFDTPFIYHAVSGSLLTDFDVTTQPSSSWSINSASSSPSSGHHYTYGTGCNSLAIGSSGGGSTHTTTWSLTFGPSFGQAVLLLGTTLLPTPLPIPGSPGCNLYQDSLLAVPVTLDIAGAISVPFTYAGSPGLRGLTLCGQFGAYDPLITRIVTSASRAVTLTDVHDGGRLYSATPSSATGTLQLGSMIVIRFKL